MSTSNINTYKCTIKNNCYICNIQFLVGFSVHIWILLSLQPGLNMARSNTHVNYGFFVVGIVVGTGMIVSFSKLSETGKADTHIHVHMMKTQEDLHCIIN